MAVEIKVPEMGESIIEATISNWIKQEGDRVAAGEAVVELETDKVNLEVAAPQGGILQGIARQVGDNVTVGDVLAQVVEDGGQAEPVKETAPQETEKPVEEPAAEPAEPVQATDAAAVKATPVAERMAMEAAVDLKTIQPTGSGGRITKEDVQTFLEKQQGQEAAPAGSDGTALPAAPAPAASPQPVQQAAGRETRQRMTRRRQTIARRLVEAQQTAAMLTTFNEVDMSRVMELRKRQREGFKERHGVDLGFMGFFIKAVIGALKAFPRLNAEIQGDEIVLKQYYDIGIAVGAEEGLVVPVIRDADRLTFAEIETQVRGFAQKARESTLSLEDLRGGTFTITNGGVFGSLLSTPILNPPQVGILGMHAIQERPVAINGEVVIRPMMYVALSYDHRIVDGREAVQFLVRMKQLVEDPESLLLS